MGRQHHAGSTLPRAPPVTTSFETCTTRAVRLEARVTRKGYPGQERDTVWFDGLEDVPHVRPRHAAHRRTPGSHL